MVVTVIILFDVLFMTAITMFWRAYSIGTTRGRGLGLGLQAWRGGGAMDAPLDDEPNYGDRRVLGPARFIRHKPSDDLDDKYPMGAINPASGLPMMPGSRADVAGNPFGTDWSSGTSSRFDRDNSFG
jgi:hypothetical protein